MPTKIKCGLPQMQVRGRVVVHLCAAARPRSMIKLGALNGVEVKTSFVEKRRIDPTVLSQLLPFLPPFLVHLSQGGACTSDMKIKFITIEKNKSRELKQTALNPKSSQLHLPFVEYEHEFLDTRTSMRYNMKEQFENLQS